LAAYSVSRKVSSTDSAPVPAINTFSGAATSAVTRSTSRRSSSLSITASPVEPSTTIPAIGVRE
jgi:hypothetical protein